VSTRPAGGVTRGASPAAPARQCTPLTCLLSFVFKWERPCFLSPVRYADDVYSEMGKRQAKMEEFRKANRVAMQETVVRQAEEKAAKDATLKATYKGSIDPHFFAQFATSHR